MSRFPRFFAGIFFTIVLLFSLTSCRHPTAFDPQKEDMLSPEEKTALLENARAGIIGNTLLTVNAYERRKLEKAQPVSYKIHYMRPKYGRAVILWAFPADRQLLATYQGPLLLKNGNRPRWQVRVVTGRVQGSADPSILEQ